MLCTHHSILGTTFSDGRDSFHCKDEDTKHREVKRLPKASEGLGARQPLGREERRFPSSEGGRESSAALRPETHGGWAASAGPLTTPGGDERGLIGAGDRRNASQVGNRPSSY